MKKNKKIKKNRKETNINNIIKSILLSNRELNYTNLKFNILKEILLSDKKEELFNKKTFDFRNLIIHYKNEINNDETLKNANFYFQELENIRIGRVNTIVNNGLVNNVVLNKMQNINRDEEIEENWIDRGYTHIKLTNGTLEVKIEDLTQLNYQLKLLELETINNIVTKSFIIEQNKLEEWLISLKNYSITTYGIKPTITRNVIFLGQSKLQLEKIFIYYCLTNGNIYAIKRTKYFK